MHVHHNPHGRPDDAVSSRSQSCPFKQTRARRVRRATMVPSKVAFGQPENLLVELKKIAGFDFSQRSQASKLLFSGLGGRPFVLWLVVPPGHTPPGVWLSF
ncbi:hypothetical protein NXC24_PB00153 (plasmid) [Rhizobium sp. NXC24]|nr:hypothetical protein NXC24_PB00153 [Rhizobium sp. NXC24]